ncbi:MAG: hypothetical protein P8J30_05500 [Ilumatobacter sp.]|nr:hypothetical protein [Ilumatobacter sp.]
MTDSLEILMSARAEQDQAGSGNCAFLNRRNGVSPAATPRFWVLSSV